MCVIYVCNMYVCMYVWYIHISSYGDWDKDLSTLCHSCWFACQQSVLKTFPVPGYLRG